MTDIRQEIEDARKQFLAGWMRLRDQGKISAKSYEKVMQAHRRLDEAMLKALREGQ